MGYPIQLTLASDARVLVAGGGAIALAKLQGLLAAGLRVSVIAEELSAEVEALRPSLASVELRSVEAADIEGYAMVIAATDDRAANAALASAARSRGVLVNAVDDPEASTFFAPAVVRRGPVSITISSDGASPLFSARLRRVMDAVLPDTVTSISDLFASIRARGLRGLAQRSRLLKALADPRLGHFVEHGDLEQAAEQIEKIAREPEAKFLAGSVAIVGAGPGAKDLLTLRALDRIQRADVILHDALVTNDVLELALPSARIIDVGRRCAGVEHKGTSVELAIALLVREAKAGARVVRLHAGDPFVFGRGGEEVDALDAAGIPWEVVPGVSSAFAAASAAGIPLTRRGEARGFTVRTGHSATGRTEAELPAEEETIVVLMGLGGARAILAKFVADGMSPATPAAAISHATLPTQKVISGTVTDLADRIDAAQLESPATLVIGQVARRAKADVALFAKVVAA